MNYDPRPGINAEIERLQAHKRAQAEDIMTLGQQIGKLEAEIERLRAALKPFADCKRGLILNPSVEDWCRARDALGNDEQSSPKQTEEQ